jgi:conjugal transfer pilus assembly protein TraU
MFTKLTSKLILLTLFSSSCLFSGAVGEAPCKLATKSGASMLQVITASLATIHNIFPIKVGSVEIDPFSGLDNYDTQNNIPVCVCLDPFPRPGIKISLWEPVSIVETTAIPYCSPTIGTSLPIDIGMGAGSFGQNSSDTARHTNTYQAHYVRFNTLALLRMFLDFACLSGGGLDYGYITELDPLWQNDIWAAIIGPEAFLVANPIAEMACMVDSVASAVGFPLDPLWWCLGSWNGTFPMTQTNKGTSAMQAQAAITSRMLMKMHRQLLLWGSVGEAGLCQKYPMPIMRKSQYGIFPIYPFVWPNRIPIGRTGVVWEAGHDSPANQHVGAWVVYGKRDCCAL